MKRLLINISRVALLSLVAMATVASVNAAPAKKSPKTTTPPVVKPYEFPVPARAAGQADVIGLTAPALDTVRVGFIGLGMRGPSAVERFTHLEGVKIAALCDIRPEKVAQCQKYLAKAGMPAAAEYSGDTAAWRKLCERNDIDLVYICTDWDNHVPMALYAMSKGKHVAVEVPATTSLKECWQMVDMSEKTRKHCMMLENCCYDFFEMATLNMAQKGLLGEIVHAEGAYIHDLRFLNFETDNRRGYYDMWRLKHNEKHTGNPYATHGLGPVCQALNVNYGDKMDYLVSISSDQFGMTEYAKNKFGANSEYAKREYAKGDMNTTVIKTRNGKTIMIQHDITSPRPYNRKHCLSGTKGFIEKYPVEGIALEIDSSSPLAVEYDNLSAHGFLPVDKFYKVMFEYEHPITKEVGAKARKVGGHGGMDFIMDYRLIYCLRNGLPLDMTVYDAASWSCIGELTEYSTKNNGAPVAIPDFTRGAWNKQKGFTHHMAK